MWATEDTGICTTSLKPGGGNKPPIIKSNVPFSLSQELKSIKQNQKKTRKVTLFGHFPARPATTQLDSVTPTRLG